MKLKNLESELSKLIEKLQPELHERQVMFERAESLKSQAARYQAQKETAIAESDRLEAESLRADGDFESYFERIREHNQRAKDCLTAQKILEGNANKADAELREYEYQLSQKINYERALILNQAMIELNGMADSLGNQCAVVRECLGSLGTKLSLTLGGLNIKLKSQALNHYV